MRLPMAAVVSLPQCSDSGFRPASPPRCKSRIAPACLEAHTGPVSPTRSTVSRHGLRSTAPVAGYGRGNAAHPREATSASGAGVAPHRPRLPGGAVPGPLTVDRARKPLTGRCDADCSTVSRDLAFVFCKHRKDFIHLIQDGCSFRSMKPQSISKWTPWARGSSSDQLIVHVWRLM